MPVFLVRHAHAGNRSTWQGEDGDRPLSDRGMGQADDLVDLLGDRTIRRVASSPARRCVQTVEPLATHLKLAVDPDKHLAEGASVRGALDLILAGDDQVLCAHGDLIPDVMVRLVDRGLRVEAPTRCQKGSVWEITIERGRPIKARYRPPRT